MTGFRHPHPVHALLARWTVGRIPRTTVPPLATALPLPAVRLWTASPGEQRHAVSTGARPEASPDSTVVMASPWQP